ncbi:hypothetical protein FOC1_g10003544, partial [Fusarium oxysporum f. sp. cubense race 1]
LKAEHQLWPFLLCTGTLPGALLLWGNGVLWSHVEGAPNEYMCRACVNDKPGSFNTYNLDDFDAHFSKKHVVEPKNLDDSIKSSYGQYLGPRPGYNYYP